MTLKISDTTMSSDQTSHTARREPSQNGWEVCQRTRSRAGCDFGLLA